MDRLGLVLTVVLGLGTALPAWGASLQAHYPFDSMSPYFVWDELNASKMGELKNGAWKGGGFEGRALYFDGVDDYCLLPEYQLANDFSISFWAKTNTPGWDGTYWWEGRGMVDCEVPNGSADFGFSVTGAKANFGVGEAVWWWPYHADVSIRSASDVTGDQWKLVTATRNGTTGEMKLYMQGYESASGTGPTGLRNSSPIMVGALLTLVGGTFFQGGIDDLRIYSGVLTPEEVKTLSYPTIAPVGVNNLTNEHATITARLSNPGVWVTPYIVGFEYGRSGHAGTEVYYPGGLAGMGDFSTQMTGLQYNTSYYFKPFIEMYETPYPDGLLRVYGARYSFSTYPWPGSGTAADPFRVSQDSPLPFFSGTDYSGVHFLLTEDISAAGYSIHIEDYNSSATAFAGIFDGGGHSVRDFTISTMHGQLWDLRNYGFIRRLSGTVKNLHVEDVSYNFTLNYDCPSKYAVMTVGGLVGYCEGGVVENCSVTGSIYCNVPVYHFGGLVGQYSSAGRITDCWADVDIDVLGGSAIGGLVGYHRGPITGSAAAGSIKIQHFDINEPYYINNCTPDPGEPPHEFPHAEYVRLGSRMGGLVGYHHEGAIDDCYSQTVFHNTHYTEDSGGLIGLLSDDKVTNCYAAQHAYGGGTEFMGLVGYVYTYGNPTVTQSFWDRQIAGVVNSPVGTGLDTADMKDPQTYLAALWDFVGEPGNGSDELWRLCNVDGEYPRLWWQYGPGDFDCPNGVEVNDLAILRRAWQASIGSGNYNPRHDINHDGVIDILDLNLQGQYWLSGQ